MSTDAGQPKRTRWWILAWLCSAWPALAAATGLNVTPVGLEFDASEPAQGIWIGNSGDTALTAQLRSFAWTQANGEDVLTPTRELVASPQLFELAPGQKQFVRVIRPQAQPQTAERAYRVLVDEVPDPAETHTGLKFVLRYSIPVFVAGTTSAPGPLAWSVDPAQPRLQTRNAGGNRVKISDLALLDAQGTALFAREGLVGYVLPGAMRAWPFDVAPQVLSKTREIRFSANGALVRQAFDALGTAAAGH